MEGSEPRELELFPIDHILACVRFAVKAPFRGAMPRLFGEKLRTIRRERSLTQGELAQSLGLASYHFITRLEGDQRTPSLDLVVRIAAILNQSTDYFLRDNIPVEETAFPPRSALASAERLPHLLGERLQTLRSQRGWNQTELAHELNLKTPSYVSNLEAGRKLPSLELLVAIADLFSVTVDELLSA